MRTTAGQNESLTLPSCRSEMEQASMKAWAMTDRQASMWSVLSMSNTNWGFFRMFTQKRRGKLHQQEQISFSNTCTITVRQNKEGRQSLHLADYTYWFSRCAGCLGLWCPVCQLAPQGSQKSIWQPEGGSPEECWGWPWRGHLRTSAEFPVEEKE